ncbi:MAG: D-cysteine desulfhydrase family protein [Bdellovibrionales bacterium]|nr:D-cysteine desulfhydrase family protein [Bdellovibrionales bacterium]
MKTPHRLKLARLPTPIHALKNTSAELRKDVYVWRDDLTGFIDSGNKIRKLEFLVGEALAQGCDHLITCGGPQSNHARATAAIARSLGLGVSLLLFPKVGFNPDTPPNGNLLIDRIFGAEITWVPLKEFQAAGSSYDPFLQREMENLKRKGKKPYIIPLGGSSAIGCFGYIAGVEEMLRTWRAAVPGSQAPDSIFCAMGSGGTYVGLSIGLKKQNLSTQLYGINVIGPVETANNYITKLRGAARDVGLPADLSNAHLIDGYVGAGYAIASDDDLRFYRDTATSEGIIFDPCYTGKAFKGMMGEVKKDPTAFGKNILFLHSGGMFGNFAYADQYKKAFGI